MRLFRGERRGREDQFLGAPFAHRARQVLRTHGAGHDADAVEENIPNAGKRVDAVVLAPLAGAADGDESADIACCTAATADRLREDAIGADAMGGDVAADIVVDRDGGAGASAAASDGTASDGRSPGCNARG